MNLLRLIFSELKKKIIMDEIELLSVDEQTTLKLNEHFIFSENLYMTQKNLQPDFSVKPTRQILYDEGLIGKNDDKDGAFKD